MKINVWGINYSPELVGIAVYNTDLCKYLASCGHDVTMVCGFAYYPAWKKQDADKGKFFAYEVKTDNAGRKVKLCRCWQYVPAKPTVSSRILHELTFVLTSFIRQLTLPAADIYVVISPPLLLGLAARIICLLKGRRYVFHVQDLQPDAALGLGMLKGKFLTKVLLWLETTAYEGAAFVSAISRSMCKIIVAKGIDRGKVVYFPNWIDRSASSDLPAYGTWKAMHGIDLSTPLVSYAGNLGVKQGLDTVIEAAKLVQEKKKVAFVIAGDGVNKSELVKLSESLGLQNMTFCDVMLPAEHMALLVDSSLCVIPQKPGAAAAFLPSKLLNILALGKPVVTNCDPQSALFEAVVDGAFGENVAAGSASGMALAIIDLAFDSDKAMRFGEAGKDYVAQFEKTTVLSEFLQALTKVAHK
jgi:colanic acid biosynthesis glycosyl transferase WcaI